MFKSNTGRLTRLASTSVNTGRVHVQLLKDFAGVGRAGEVLWVPAGQMRNQLHPKNGAYYVLDETNLRIPRVKRADLLAKSTSRVADNATASSGGPQGERSRTSEKPAKSLESMTSLVFEVKAAGKRSLDPLELRLALQSLPPVITLSIDAASNGFLTYPYTAKNLSEKVEKLVGAPISPKKIEFAIKRGYTSNVIDFVGRYEVTFKLGDDVTLRRGLLLTCPSVTERVQRPDKPLPKPENYFDEGIAPAVSEPSTSEEQEETSFFAQPSEENAGNQKQFEWENDYISDLEEKLKKK